MSEHTQTVQQQLQAVIDRRRSRITRCAVVLIGLGLVFVSSDLDIEDTIGVLATLSGVGKSLSPNGSPARWQCLSKKSPL